MAKALAMHAWDPLDVEVVAGAPPTVRLHGARRTARRRARRDVDVSLTHSRGMAGAVAVLSP